MHLPTTEESLLLALPAGARYGMKGCGNNFFPSKHLSEIEIEEPFGRAK